MLHFGRFVTRHSLSSRTMRFSVTALCFAAFAVAMPYARAQVSVQGFFIENAGPPAAPFFYNFQVTNGPASPFALSIVSIALPADPLAVQNPAAPAGFLISFDPNANGPGGPGLLSFVEGTSAFEIDTITSGFTFNSPFALEPSDFEAIDINGNSFTGTTTISAAPEAATLSLFALAGMVSAAGIAVRRRRS